MRLEQLAKQCQRRGGDCPCVIDCEAERACNDQRARAAMEMQEAENRIRHLEQVARRLKTPPAKLKEGFAFTEGLVPVIVFDGDEACFGYEDEDGEWVEANVWPFDQQFIWWDDCERHGIRVE